MPWWCLQEPSCLVFLGWTWAIGFVYYYLFVYYYFITWAIRWRRSFPSSSKITGGSSFVMSNDIFFCVNIVNVSLFQTILASLIIYSIKSVSVQHFTFVFLLWITITIAITIKTNKKNNNTMQLEEHSYAFFLVCTGIFLMMCGFFFGFFKRSVIIWKMIRCTTRVIIW